MATKVLKDHNHHKTTQVLRGRKERQVLKVDREILELKVLKVVQ